MINKRPLQNAPFWPISASGSNFNPRNIQYIPVVEIFVFLDLEQNRTFFKGLKKYLSRAKTPIYYVSLLLPSFIALDYIDFIG